MPEVVMSMKTQGTHLYAIDPDSCAVFRVGCVTSLDGISATRDQRENTCLEDDARTYEAGMLTPGAASVGLNFDVADDSHIRLHELYAAGDNIRFAIGLSDGVSPANSTSDCDFDLPTDRSWILFEGYVSDFPFSFAISANVTTTVGIQISGAPVPVKKTTV